MASEIKNKADMIWNIADILRGPYKPSEYGEVILPFTVMRRFDCVLRPTNDKVMDMYKNVKGKGDADRFLKIASGHNFYNVSGFTFDSLRNDPLGIETKMREYINGFSPNVREILEKFEIDTQINRLAEEKLLFNVVSEFASPKNDLSPEVISNSDMGHIFEEIIRKFSESHNEEAGEYYTPREVIALMAEILIRESDLKEERSSIRTIYDPACGTGGMLSEAMDHISKQGSKMDLICYGQEVNQKTYAICQADMLIKNQHQNSFPDEIYNGNTLTDDKFSGKKFNYIISNPPFGTKWEKDYTAVLAESKNPNGRFSIGLPQKSDGQMLFLEIAISKMRPVSEGGGRVTIIHNGSPLFNGDAGSGPSEIRKYIIENDLLDAIIQLPENIFYNTGITTYIWVLDNNKPDYRKGKVQLIEASKMYEVRPKNVGNKRFDVSAQYKDVVVKAYREFRDATYEVDGKVCESKIVNGSDFGYVKVTVNTPVLDSEGNPVYGKRGKVQIDKKKKDTENIPINQDVQEYIQREVLPYNPHAIIDTQKTKIGYEIPFTRYFYKYSPPRPPEEILVEIKQLESEISKLMKELYN